MKIKGSQNQIENGCLVFLKQKETDTAYDIEKALLVFSEYFNKWYYIIDISTNRIVGKYETLEGLQKSLEGDYHILKVIKADKLVLSWED